MKKIITLFISIMLLLSLSLSGCSCGCNSTDNLKFNHNFYGGKEAPPIGYTETSIYSVNYNGDGKDYPNLEKNSDTDIETIVYSGTLTTKLEISNISSIPTDGMKSDILSEENIKAEDISKIYVYKTALDLVGTYTFSASETPIVVNDKIETSVYFLPNSLAFAPIYSTYYADMHVLAAGSDSKLWHYKYYYETLYNLDEFILDKTIEQFEVNSETLIGSDSESKEKGYDYKKAIDNNQLLFALRNYSTDNEDSTAISVISPAYGDDASLLISKHTMTTQTLNLVNNGTEVSGNISVKNFSLNVNDKYASGENHYFSIQTNSSENIANKSLLTKFAQPVFNYSPSPMCVGALEFKLVEVAYN